MSEPQSRGTRRRTRGDGALYKANRTGLWTAAVELPSGEDGRRRRAVVSSKDRNTALARLRALRRQVEDGHVPARGRAPSVRKVLEDWLASRPSLSPASVRSYRASINTQITPHIGAKPITLDAADLRKMYAAWAASGAALQTMQKAHHVMRSTMKWAVREGLRRDNPLDRIETPFRNAPKGGSPAPLSASEAEAVLAAAAQDPRDPFYERWAFQLLHGTRQGETLGLLVESLDFDNLTVDISWQLQRVSLKERSKPLAEDGRYPLEAFAIPYGYECRPIWKTFCLVRTKTRKQRLVPLAAVIAEDLRAHVESQGKRPGDLVWTRPDGRPLHATQDLAAWKAALVKAGVAPKGTHAGRHTTNTLLLERGVPEDVRMQILGHSTVAVNQKYSHVDMPTAREALAKLGDLLPPRE